MDIKQGLPINNIKKEKKSNLYIFFFTKLKLQAVVEVQLSLNAYSVEKGLKKLHMTCS